MCHSSSLVVNDRPLSTLQSLPAGLSQASFLSGPERRFIQLQQSKGSKGTGSSAGGAAAAVKGGAGEAEAFSDWRLIREAFGNWRVWYVSIMVSAREPLGREILAYAGGMVGEVWAS